MKYHFLITAGPTQEPLDPVRYLSNHSSGKMGYSLAQAALNSGHRVTLISGPTALKPPLKSQFISVVTAEDMLQATLKQAGKAHILIMVAAVADYRPQKPACHKIKKDQETLTLTLVKNTDILKTLGNQKGKTQLLVGFAAETQKALEYGQKKLREKNCDVMIVNNVAQKGIGFASDHNEVTLLSAWNKPLTIKKMTKTRLAKKIIDYLLNLAQQKEKGVLCNPK